jgi:hypothetical protein
LPTLPADFSDHDGTLTVYDNTNISRESLIKYA